ncbi:MAG: NAD(P)H-dependent oxidoreductase [Burkholderiales bacterium]
MGVLVVYAHPNPQSFNHAILDHFTKGLTEAGHTTDVVDLYGIDFDPCVRLADLAQFTDGEMPSDVVEQQQKVTNADGIAMIHPIWGWSFPAILKGWMDRVFSYGFAYEAGERGVRGLLEDRKTTVMSTAGGPEEFYETAGYMDAFITTCNGIFNVSGIHSVEYPCFYGVRAAGDEGRKKYLEQAFTFGKTF